MLVYGDQCISSPKRQIISLWIFAILWALTLFIWYSADQYGWGFTQFLQATAFWSIFALLTHFSLNQLSDLDKFYVNNPEETNTAKAIERI